MPTPRVIARHDAVAPQAHTPDHGSAQAPHHRRRYHAFDALRAGAMLLGVVLHAAVPYLRWPMPNLLWPVHDQPAGTWLDVVFWWLHVFRIPLFFVMAGFFSAMLLTARGVRPFVHHRLTRIGAPLLAAMVIILPAVYLIWGWGWTISGLATFREVRHLSFSHPHLRAHFLGPAHLWFLQFLLLYCLIYASWVAWRLPGTSALLRHVVTGPLCPLLLAIGSGVILAFDPGVLLAFRNDLLPHYTDLLYHGWFFIVGLSMFHGRDGLDRVERMGLWYALIGTAAFVVSWLLIQRQLTDAGDVGTAIRWALPASAAIACWGTVYGMIGLGLRWLDRDAAWVRWLSDSAYWVYLIHLPLVGVMHVLLWRAPLPSPAKFGLTVAVAAGISLLTYRLFVRYSVLGRWLNGPRARPATARRNLSLHSAIAAAGVSTHTKP